MPTFIRRTSGDVEVLYVRGELDLSTVGELESAIERAGATERTLMVDLSGCRYVDASVLGALVRARKRLGPAMRVAVGARSIADRLVRLAGLRDYLNVVQTIGSA